MVTATSAAPPLIPPDLLPHSGKVRVRVHRLLCANAVCSCGWCGERRHLKASAELDAWQHAMKTRCDVSFPLITRW